MNSSANRQITTPLDSLDYHHEQFNRSKHFPPVEQKEEVIFKNFYKQQLDEILNQKNKYKSLEKHKEQQQRRLYNERVRLGQQAERIKQLSYKNYYQMIMNNQQNIKNKYISPFEERDQLKNKLINKGVEEGRIKSQIDYEREVNRQQNLKRDFQTVLSHQVNQKQQISKKEFQQKHKTNQYLRNVLLTPNEIDKLERQKKLNQMNKYREDLDKIVTQKYNMSQSQLQNPQMGTKSPMKSQRHDLLLNPLPFNIQNPYILRQMQRKNMINNYNSHKTIPDHPNTYQQSRNNIFG